MKEEIKQKAISKRKYSVQPPFLAPFLLAMFKTKHCTSFLAAYDSIICSFVAHPSNESPI